MKGAMIVMAAIAAAAIGSSPAFAQAALQPAPGAASPVVRPVRVQQPPAIDGRLDDEAWRGAAHVTNFLQRRPLDGTPASERTDVYIAYDNERLYFGVYAHYSEPSLVRANRVDRDQIWEDDRISVIFDPFQDQQRAYRFAVNGYGVQGDALVANNG